MGLGNTEPRKIDKYQTIDPSQVKGRGGLGKSYTSYSITKIDPTRAGLSDSLTPQTGSELGNAR